MRAFIGLLRRQTFYKLFLKTSGILRDIEHPLLWLGSMKSSMNVENLSIHSSYSPALLPGKIREIFLNMRSFLHSIFPQRNLFLGVYDGSLKLLLSNATRILFFVAWKRSECDVKIFPVNKLQNQWPELRTLKQSASELNTSHTMTQENWALSDQLALSHQHISRN